MNEFVIRTYASILRKFWNSDISRKDLLSLLFYSVGKPLGHLIDDDEYGCSKDRAQRIFDRTANAPDCVRDGVELEKVKITLPDYFEKEVLVNIRTNQEVNLLYRIMQAISRANLAPERVDEFKDLQNRHAYAEFLARAFAESLGHDNRQGKKKNSDYGGMKVLDYKELPVPIDVVDDEKDYIDALLDVYGEAEDVPSFTIEDVRGSDHEEHYDFQRASFYSTESLRQGTRELADYSGQDPFEDFEKTIEDGIKPTHMRTYKRNYTSGYDCLDAVLEAAVTVQVSHLPYAEVVKKIDSIQKIGMCHFLVNDGRIEGWARHDK